MSGEAHGDPDALRRLDTLYRTLRNIDAIRSPVAATTPAEQRREVNEALSPGGKRPRRASLRLVHSADPAPRPAPSSPPSDNPPPVAA